MSVIATIQDGTTKVLGHIRRMAPCDVEMADIKKWLKKAGLKYTTLAIIIAAQEQAK